MPRRPAAVLVSLALASPFVLLAGPASAAAAAARPYDLDGDGRPELVVGSPGLRVGAVAGAGGVVVLPATKKGLSLEEQVVTRASADVVGDPQGGAGFGGAVTSADFDRDGYADLAVGSADETVGGVEAAGTVTVLYGSADGITGKRSVQLVEPGGPQDRAQLGRALVAADLDGDGYADLAVGTPLGDRVVYDDEDFDATGAVDVFRGGASGLVQARVDVLHGTRTKPAYDVRFGSSLAVGDLDGDGKSDLVVGSGGQGFEDGDGYRGTVSVCYGGSSATTCTRLAQTGVIAGLTSLAVGNVSGSARPEVVVGVPDADRDQEAGGAVQTLRLSGSSRASTTVTLSQLDQSTKGVPGSDERGDHFGQAVALGDLDRDGYADLVVGAPGEDVGKRVNAGRVTVVRGGKNGYRTSGNKLYDQNTEGVPGSAETNDGFGASVALLDHDRDGHLDLTVGAPGENDDAGVVTTLRGSGSSFTTKGARTFGLATLGLPDVAGAGFASALGH